MSFLSLKDIGKIYVSDNNVTVGIRGVNLNFEKGEFVAVTGKSGSGKSTLLNVISGMDTYEEGELLIEGEPTSHFLQPDWEKYRSEYISFIFQDYNIIESFTVLQNVELALMHIEDKKERRKRALDLIDRVGMTSHIKHKGSKLSGGQKQRTVIARALAKESPIILADEPTGNLDSATSAEIIKLLMEVSKDKLLIVVTHNYEEVEQYATRHIRFFDGAVESDTVMREAQTFSDKKEKEKVRDKTFVENKKKDIKDGLTLGKAIFTSRPKLSIFLCLLLIIGTLGVFAVTSFCGDMSVLFEKQYMFNNIEGRLILTKRNGEVIEKEELEKIVSEYGAESFLHYDILLDSQYGYGFSYYDEKNDHRVIGLNCTYSENFGDDIIGKYPSKENEVFLYLPISESLYFGEKELKINEVKFSNITYTVTGVKYFYDNNKMGECLFTEDGFSVATAINYLSQKETNITVNVTPKNSFDGALSDSYNYYSFIPSFEIESGKIYICEKKFQNFFKDKYNVDIKFSSIYYKYNYEYDYGYGYGYGYSSNQKQINFNKSFDESYLTDKEPQTKYNGEIIIHPSLLVEITNEVLEKSYRQASVFFESTEKAQEAAEKLNKLEYLAVPANTTYSSGEAADTIMNVIAALFTAIFWFLAIVFLAFFLNLCTGRTLDAFKGDMAIMRSMGIRVRVIRIGMYMRMFISLIPAFVAVLCAAVYVFTSPKLNQFFIYLYWYHYAFIVLGVIILVYRITKKQIKRLFGESVKKSLKGGDAE